MISSKQQPTHLTIFGYPIGHSKSPVIHQQFGLETNISLQYDLTEVKPEAFKETVSMLFKSRKIIGANVTVPHKVAAFELADALTEEAKAAGAVNTLSYREGILWGHNTDGPGLMEDFKKKGITLIGKRVLILGAGGAVRGSLLPLAKEMPKEVVIMNRTFSRGETLVLEFSQEFARYSSSLKALPWGLQASLQRNSTLLNDCQPFDIIINATSSSLTNEFTPLPQGVIAPTTIGYDLVYSDNPTLFMQYIKEKGGREAYDGLGMLVEQAALAFEFWFTIKPETHQVTKQLRP